MLSANQELEKLKPFRRVGGVVVRIPAFHAGGQGFDSLIRQS